MMQIFREEREVIPGRKIEVHNVNKIITSENHHDTKYLIKKRGSGRTQCLLLSL